jgi:tetratricopeptide (TPR) repeat protein
LVAVFLLAVTVAIVLVIRRRPYMAVGWAWYLGTLVPVIGLVQVGRQAMADRYAYVPLIGVFLMLAWAARDLVARRKVKPVWCAVAAGAVLVPLAACTWVHVGYWHDSIALFTHALEVTENNDVAHQNLAVALMDADRLDEAIVHFEQALDIRPTDAQVLTNLGIAWARKGQLDEAERNLTNALQIEPTNADAHFALSRVFAQKGDVQQAARHCQEGTRLQSLGPGKL